MELLEYLYIIRKRIWIIVAVTVAAALTSGIISIFVMHPVYQAKATLIIGRTPMGDKDKVQYNDILMYTKLVKTYAELAKSRLIAEETLAELKYDITPEKFQKKLVVTPKGDTNIMEIAIQDTSPDNAVALTNTLSNIFVKRVREMLNAEDVKILDKAQKPEKPVSPRVLLNIVIAAFLGLMASVGGAFLVEFLDNTIKTENDVEKYLAITVLASIPYINDKEI